VSSIASATANDRQGRLNALRTAIGVVLFGGTVLVAMHDWLGLGGAGLDSFTNGALYDAVILSAGACCVLKAMAGGHKRSAWLAIAAAIFAWGLAEIYWTAFIADDPSAPYPSPADVGYLAYYPLAAVGLGLLVRARAHELDWRLWMDGLIAALGTAALGAAFVFEFVADRTGGTALEKATTLAYPLGDIVMLSLVVGVVALTRWRPGRTWSLLLVGLAFLVVADTSYTLHSVDSTLPGGDWIEPIYLIAAVCIGAEAWQPQADLIKPAARFDGWRELMVPGFFAAVMIGLFSMQYFSSATSLTTVLWTATMLAVIARLAISVRENKQLLEQVRTDQLTGLGNQGRLQVDLAAQCERAGNGELALLLLLLDLNGFKRYNDTFGHPAGDEMLARMGARLRHAVSGNGVAYRVGGDEFAVLIDCEESRQESVAKGVAEALSESGGGYDVSASWGAAAIPADAADPKEAMRLADIRMYAQKESRRVAHVPAAELEAVENALPRVGDSEALEQRQ
jgi:two-component system, cell cycle response regulator